MQVRQLALENFRNYGTLCLQPGTGLNVFVGRNAQGKSNLLESLYVLATSKSVRAVRDAELIRFDQPAARITADVARERGVDIDIELTLSQTEKKAARINGVRHTKLAEVIGQVNAVLFDSGDLEIIRGEPSVRRRFLDLEIAQTSPRYVYALGAFRKALEQRNRLLRDLRDGRAGADARAVLPAWNAQMVQHGGLLIERRRRFLDRLAQIAAGVHETLSDGRDALEIAYAPSFALGAANEAPAIQALFLAALAGMEAEELARGTTARGPQRE